MEKSDAQIQGQYMRGFKQGYLLAQTAPSLAEALSALDIKHDAMRGLRDGNTLYKLEQVKEKGLDSRAIANEKASMEHTDPWIKSYGHGQLIAKHIPELIPPLLSIQAPGGSKEFDGLQIGIRHVIEDMVHHMKSGLLDEKPRSQEEPDPKPKKPSRSMFVDWPKDENKDKDPDPDPDR